MKDNIKFEKINKDSTMILKERINKIIDGNNANVNSVKLKNEWVIMLLVTCMGILKRRHPNHNSRTRNQ